MRSTITIDWSDEISLSAIHEAEERIEDVVKQFLIFNYTGQHHEVRIDQKDTEQEPDPILEDVDAAYRILGLVQSEIEDASQDWEFAGVDMMVGISEHDAATKTIRTIKELIDPREGEENV